MATWAAASVARVLPPRRDVVRLSEAITCASGALAACHAGASPNSAATISVARAQKASTRRSKDRVTGAGSRSGGMTDGATLRIADSESNSDQSTNHAQDEAFGQQLSNDA